VILIREKAQRSVAVGTFDYSDLNAYLLVVVGLAHPEDDQKQLYDGIASKARDGKAIPLRDIQSLAKKGPLITVSQTDDLSSAIEHFGSGVHRVVVCKDGTDEVVGILSQLRLVRFLWENGSSFPGIDKLYSYTLKDLGIGTPHAISIK
jgi:CBS domain-containing protein